MKPEENLASESNDLSKMITAFEDNGDGGIRSEGTQGRQTEGQALLEQKEKLEQQIQKQKEWLEKSKPGMQEMHQKIEDLKKEKQELASDPNIQREKKIEKAEDKNKEKVEFAEQYFTNMYELQVKPWQGRMQGGSESAVQFVKDILFLGYQFVDTSMFVYNDWKYNESIKGNMKLITERKKNDCAIQYSASKPISEMNYIIGFLKLNYGIDNIDHFIRGYDINAELKK